MSTAVELNAALAELARSRLGLDLSAFAPAVVRRTLARMPGDYADLPTSQLVPLLSSLCVGETTFMRHSEHFEALRQLAPGIASDGRQLRVWSAGCSTGEEAYSLAAVLRAVGIRADVLATDVNARALAFARRGVYRPWSLRSVDLAANPWLRFDGLHVEVAPTIHSCVRFEPLNLATDPFPTGMDVIFCRNVLIYFHRDEALRVIRRMASALAPGGILVLGYVDPQPDLSVPVKRHTFGRASIYRRIAAIPNDGVRPPVPALRGKPEPPTPPVPAPPPAPVTRTSREGERPEMDQAYEHTEIEQRMLQVRSLLLQGQRNDAMREAERLRDALPGEAAPCVLLSVLAEESGDIEYALGMARRSAALVPDEPVAQLLMGHFLAEKGARELARVRITYARRLLDALPAGATPKSLGLDLDAAQLRRMIDAEARRLA